MISAVAASYIWKWLYHSDFGVIGAVQFDKNGDITGPFRLWRIQDGAVKTVGEMSAEEVDKVKASLK